MSEPWPTEVIVAAIGAAAVVLSALLGVVGIIAQRAWNAARNSEKTSAEALHQVKNDHDVNLRDDLDGKHDDVKEALADFRAEYQTDQMAIFAELRSLSESDVRQGRRIRNIEDTMPGRSIYEPPRKGRHS